jgi:ribosomal protein L31
MIRNLKALGLALVAVFAMSAVAASAASAQQGHLTSDGNVTLDITEIAGELNALTAFGAKTECPGTTLTGHKYNVTPHTFIPSGETTATVTPDYNATNCHATEGATVHKATVTQNGCDYVFHIGSTVAADQYSLTVDIECTSGPIVVDVYAFANSELGGVQCEVKTGTQTGLTGPTLTDETNGHLKINGTFTGIHVERHSPTGAAACPDATVTNGEFHINATITGTNEAGTSTEVSISE